MENGEAMAEKVAKLSEGERGRRKLEVGAAIGCRFPSAPKSGVVTGSSARATGNTGLHISTEYVWQFLAFPFRYGAHPLANFAP